MAPKTHKNREVDSQNRYELVVACFTGSTKLTARCRQKVRNPDLKEAETSTTPKNREVDSPNRSYLVVARFSRIDEKNS